MRLPNIFIYRLRSDLTRLATGSLFANQNYLAAGFPAAVCPRVCFFFVLAGGEEFKFGIAQQWKLTIGTALPVRGNKALATSNE